MSSITVSPAAGQVCTDQARQAWAASAPKEYAVHLCRSDYHAVEVAFAGEHYLVRWTPAPRGGGVARRFEWSDAIQAGATVRLYSQQSDLPAVLARLRNATHPSVYYTCQDCSDEDLEMFLCSWLITGAVWMPGAAVGARDQGAPGVLHVRQLHYRGVASRRVLGEQRDEGAGYA